MLWVVLPAYREADNLPPLLRDLRATMDAWHGAPAWRAIVVDDGSDDGTAEAAASVADERVEVVRHPRNLGLGAAVRTGIEHVLARASDDDAMAMLDADHTHPTELLPALWERARAGSPLVIASRYRPGARVVGLGAGRRALSAGASVVLRLLFPCGARDYTCGYRLYRVGLLRAAHARYGRAFLNQRGFTVTADLLLKLRRTARPIEEVPLVLRYDRKVGPSKMKVVRTIAATLRLLGRRFLGDPRGP